MPIATCENCGETVNLPLGTELCQKCRLEEIEIFRSVREYVWEHPGCTVEEVAKETEIRERVILRFVRQGRLKIRE
jgi:uncharacterized protein